MKKFNNKGFTLIELLAVIVILGVLMIIAIPMVSRYIKEARQNAFIDTAKAYVSSARYAFLNSEYDCNLDSGTGGTRSVYIIFDNIEVDKTGGKSSFNKNIDTAKSYVKITADEDGKYTYSVAMRDAGNNGFDITAEEDLKRKSVVANITSIALPSATEATACSWQTE